MLKRYLISSLVLLGVLFQSQAHGLEKRRRLVDDSANDDWGASTSCRISYYNICTGWIWLWGPFEAGTRFGVLVDGCCPPNGTASLQQVDLFFSGGVGCGRGFTGTMEAYAADANGCPVGKPLATRIYCPDRSSWTDVVFGGVEVPSRFVLVNTVLHDPPGCCWEFQFVTDYPGKGPTGPEACGVCFPTTRQTHSFVFGKKQSPLCPGDTFIDGACDAELFWDISVSCPTDVEDTSWGAIKNLYH